MRHAYWTSFCGKCLNSFEENSILSSWIFNDISYDNVPIICVLLSYYNNYIIELFHFCSSSYYKVFLLISDGILTFENISGENAFDLVLMALFAFFDSYNNILCNSRK